MVHYRRQDPTIRRRRIVTSRFASEYGESSGSAKSPAAGRRREQLRAARRGSRAYGSAVRRRLRGRWFQLVPVHRSQLAGAVAVPLILAFCLIAAGYAAIYWPPLASHAEVARPFRLDVPGSLADWMGSQFLLLGAGCSFLIYQMRRYRADDFQGHYRLWRPIILLLLVASLDAVVRVRDALGGVIDLIQGDAIVMAGADAVRLAMLIGGAAMAIPLIREMRRVAMANVVVVAALLSLAVPTLLRLGIAGDVDPADGSLVAGSARMLGRTLLLVAAIVYLRKVFREVRGLDVDEPSTGDVVTRQQRNRVALQPIDEDDEEYLASSGIPIDPRQWFRWRRGEDAGTEPEVGEDESDEDDAPPRRRRLFGWMQRTGRSLSDGSDGDEELEEEAAQEEEESWDDEPSEDGGDEGPWEDGQPSDWEDEIRESGEASGDGDDPPTRKRRWLKLPALRRRRLRLPRPRLRVPNLRLPSVRLPRPRMPKVAIPRPRLALPSFRMPLPSRGGEAGEGAKAPTQPASSDAPSGAVVKESRKGSRMLSKVKEVRLWKRRSPEPESRAGEPQNSAERSKRSVVAAQEMGQEPAEQDEADGSDIDWSKLSKSERRRLRKTLRRQQNAA